jgi:succinate dehydrogenase/fumarate reductase flavoprotein subunit
LRKSRSTRSNCHPRMLNTQGGPRRNEKGQIVRPHGTPIRRLYSAGELGSIYSYLYQGTGNIGECLAFGRVSGRHAAAEMRFIEALEPSSRRNVKFPREISSPAVDDFGGA